MKRIGNISPKIETPKNFEAAFWDYSKGKKRKEIDLFWKDLEVNLQKLLEAYRSETWRTSPYQMKIVYEPKVRPVHKLPVADHVMQHAVMRLVEPYLRRSLYWKSPAGTKGKGTHFFHELIKRDIYDSPQTETFYYLSMDIHHYFPSIDHGLLKQEYRRKIKDKKLLAFIDEVVDSFNPGIVLGVKLTQLLGQLYLYRFDYLMARCFDILSDPDKFRYWQSRYVSDSFVTCRTADEMTELSKGVEYMNAKFTRYCSEGLRYYYRFMDNMYVMHRDKVFLRIMAELAIMCLANRWRLSVNRSWNINRLCDGMDACGRIFYPDHTRMRKNNKQKLCRQIYRLRKQGRTQREIELEAAPRLGMGIHADTKHLYKKIGMERFGKLVKKRKYRAPFEGMTKEQKLSVENLVCPEGADETKYLLQVIDYKVEDSIIEKDTVKVMEQGPDGNLVEVTKEVPKKCLVFRYRRLERMEGDTEIWEEEEHFTYTGSAVMVDQALNDFSRDELPFSTVICEFKNKFKKKFYKFT